MNQAKYQTQYVPNVPINDLKPSEFNSRSNTEKQAFGLDTSLERFGLLDPLIVNSAPNRKNKIIGGHFRWREAKKLGYKEVPVIYANIPDIEKEKEINLRLNSNIGQWDLEKLFKEFDIEMTIDVGLDDQLEQYWDQTLSVEDDEFDVNKTIASIKTPRTELGDLIYFGENGWHRLICQDSTNPAAVARLVGENKINILDFDPVYNIGLDYQSGFSAKGKYGSQKINDKKPDEEYRNFLKSALENGLKHSNPDAHVFCWCDQNYVGMLQGLYKELGITNKRTCLWVKNSINPTPQTAFNKAYEPCVYGTIGSPYLSPNIHNFNEVLNKEIDSGNRLADSVLDIIDIWLAKRIAGQEYKHPTEKPASLYEKVLRRCSKPGDIVLDLFAGSSPLLSACHQLKRRAFLAELDPVFCDVIVARYRELTGKEAMYVSAEK
jgi:DNA modification methylase